MADKLSEVQSRLEAAQSRIQRDKNNTKHLESALVRKSVGAMSSGIYGAMNRFGVPVTIKGFPWKLGVWVGATVMEALTRGMVQAASGAVSDNTMGIYIYDAVTKGTVIAGDDENASDGGSF